MSDEHDPNRPDDERAGTRSSSTGGAQETKAAGGRSRRSGGSRSTQDRIPMDRILRIASIVFLDMKEREEQARRRLQHEADQLEAQKPPQGKLPHDLEQRLKKIKAMLKSPAVVDPLFRAVRDTLDRMGYQRVGDHVDGVLPSQTKPNVPLTEDEVAVAAVYGLLSADNVTNPSLGDRVDADSVDPDQLIIGDRFVKALAVVLGEYTAAKPLFDNVLRVVATEGRKRAGVEPSDVDGTVLNRSSVRTPQIAVVTRDLHDDNITAEDEQFALQVRIRLGNQLAASESAVPSSINIDLPDLEAEADIEIVADNLRAMQAIHFSAMLEELRLFQVADKLVEQFQNGLLPFGRGPAGDALFLYWKKGINRLSEVERRNIYARTLGMPGGDPTIVSLNREYADLFLRFVSAVSSFVRQFKVDELLRSGIPFHVSTEHVRKSARDLAANLSLFGYGIAHFAATELQAQIKEIVSILNQQEVRLAYGARDWVQVVDQVATLDLGGARNSIRYRTMANSGAIIIRWLAERAAIIASGYGSDILNTNEIRQPAPRLPGSNPLSSPTDRDLVDAVEQWLAVTGTSDARVEEYSQPVEGPSTTSRPVAIPQVARDLLDSVGISAGYGGGTGSGNGHSRIPGYQWR